jgi:hypothetical protein
MMPLKFILAVAFLVANIPAFGSPNQAPKKESAKANQKADDLMKRKLEHAQKVLEGIALNDFDRITKHAEELIVISHEAEWKAIKLPDYELYSGEFRRSAQTLVKNATAKNLDGAALAYVELTMSCVKCHKHVREVRMTRRD